MAVERMSVLAALCCCFFMVFGCGPGSQQEKEPDFTIKVTGTRGNVFRGNYMAITEDGKSKNTTVTERIPASYPVNGVKVSCNFQKQGKAGRLKVEILAHGEVVAKGETFEAYGSVTVSAP